MSSLRTATRRPRAEHGYSPVEAVVTFPALLLIVLTVVQFALLWHARNVAQAAAQDGLQTARSYEGTAEQGRQDASDYLAQVAPRLLQAPDVQVTRGPAQVDVLVTGRVLSILPLGLIVTEHVTGPVERFVGPG